MEDSKYASVKFKGKRIVPKAFMQTKKIKLREGFGIQQTTFVPEAQEGKPMPMLCMTLSVGGDSIRMNANTAEDLLLSLSAMMEQVASCRDRLDQILSQEQEQWIIIHRAILDVKKSPKGVNFDTHEDDEKVIPMERKKVG